MKKNGEARELNIFEKTYIRLHFPNLKKYKRRQEHENSQKKFRIRIVDVNRLEFLEKLPKRLEGYLKQLNDNFGTLKSNEERINNLDNKVTKAFEMLKEKEHQRRKAAGKVGGLTAKLNSEKKENEKLKEEVKDLKDNVKDLEDKLEESMSDKYLVKKIPSGRRPKTQVMKIKSCTVQSNIARKMFERGK